MLWAYKQVLIWPCVTIRTNNNNTWIKNTLLINDSCDLKTVCTAKYWKYQYISIYFLILSIHIDINEFPIKRYIMDICRIKRYFPIPKHWFTDHHWGRQHWIIQELQSYQVSIVENYILRAEVFSFLSTHRLLYKTRS